MDILLTRKQHSDQSMMGDMETAGIHICFALEPPNPIPVGTYELRPWPDPEIIPPPPVKHNYTVPILINVPGHTFIEIHIGNSAKDTENCILVGMSRNPDWVGSSTEAFLILMLKYIVPAWLRNEVVRITIKEEL